MKYLIIALLFSSCTTINSGPTIRCVHVLVRVDNSVECIDYEEIQEGRGSLK